MTRKDALRSIAMKRIAASRAISRFARQHGGDPRLCRYRRTAAGGEYRLTIGEREAGIGFEVSQLERDALK